MYRAKMENIGKVCQKWLKYIRSYVPQWGLKKQVNAIRCTVNGR